MPDPSNKRPAHGVRFLNDQPTVVFDTICTKDKTPWLDDPIIHDCLVDVWRNADLWLVGRYVIMPNHIHLFAWATDTAIDFENWVKYWKSQFSRLHKDPKHKWQPDHWDTRMRNAAAYEDKWNYVRQNPVRHGFVVDPDDWPYQGEVFEMRWGG